MKIGGDYMRLIDADALIEDIKTKLWDWDTVDGITSSTVLKQTITDIDNAPTIDVVPVVRCKDCKHWDEHSQYGCDSENGVYGNYCMLWTPYDDFYAVETPEDGFCYCGERKDNG